MAVLSSGAKVQEASAAAAVDAAGEVAVEEGAAVKDDRIWIGMEGRTRYPAGNGVDGFCNEALFFSALVEHGLDVYGPVSGRNGALLGFHGKYALIGIDFRFTSSFGRISQVGYIICGVGLRGSSINFT